MTEITTFLDALIYVWAMIPGLYFIREIVIDILNNEVENS
jgi:hypothetical protein